MKALPTLHDDPWFEVEQVGLKLMACDAKSATFLKQQLYRTAHAGALSALVETANTYRFYFGAYVRNVGPFTPVYMALIARFANSSSICYSCAACALAGIKHSAQGDVVLV